MDLETFNILVGGTVQNSLGALIDRCSMQKVVVIHSKKPHFSHSLCF